MDSLSPDNILSRFKIRTKLLVAFVVLLGLWSVASMLVRDRLVDMRDEVDALVREHHPVELLANRLDAELDDIITTLSTYVSVRDDELKSAYHRSFNAAFETYADLARNPVVNASQTSKNELAEIRSRMDRLRLLGEELLRIASSDELTYPGLAYANRNLNPLNREILQLFEQVLLELKDDQFTEADRLKAIVNDMRYYWINVVSAVRGYLAYRSDRVLHDAALYLSAVRDSLRKVGDLGEPLPLDTEAAVKQITDTLEDFDAQWLVVQQIHGGDGWRADDQLIRTQIAPLYGEIEQLLTALQQKQNAEMDAVLGQVYSDSIGITHIANVFLLVGLLVSLAMAWGISHLVTMPLHRAARAMQGIASGNADLAQRLQAEGSDEVAVLARSFNTFIAKVQRTTEEEQALAQLLRVSLEHTELPVYLDQALALLIGTVTWLGLTPRGGIFITDDETGSTLNLMARHNFSVELQTLCAKVEFGHCLCGKAAVSGQIEFADCVDDRHDITFEGMWPHGHYNVPIKLGNEVLGVLVLYLPSGHPHSESEVSFLYKVAEVLSMGITLRQANAELVDAKHRAETANDQLTGITANIPGIIFQRRFSIDGSCTYPYVGPGTSTYLGESATHAEPDMVRLFADVHPADRQRLNDAWHQSEQNIQSITVEYRFVTEKTGTRWILCTAVPRSFADDHVLWDGLLIDITDRKNLETQLLQAQKLESVGQLAAGIAHEINTPTQFVQDNIHFLQEAFEDYRSALTVLRRLRSQIPADPATDALVAEVDQIIADRDIDYVDEEIPSAISQSLEGVHRIATIVGAMKEFSHPGTDNKQPVDVNAVIRNIVTVSRNEWKYVADLDVELAEHLLSPLGYRDKLGQVILNLIVNAAHAINDKVQQGQFDKGHIRIETSSYADGVEIRVQDDGPGVPEAIQRKIFDPFFTTKDVGKGTGQGLSISRSVVVDQHGGALELESTPGEGATFIIRLPACRGQDDDMIAA